MSAISRKLSASHEEYYTHSSFIALRAQLTLLMSRVNLKCIEIVYCDVYFRFVRLTIVCYRLVVHMTTKDTLIKDIHIYNRVLMYK